MVRREQRPLRVIRWKTVDGFPRYAVSHDGRVRIQATKHVMRPHIINSGYARVTLHHDGRFRRAQISHLVAEAFIGTRPEGLEIDHKDGNKLNDAARNLEYVTHSENAKRWNARLQLAGIKTSWRNKLTRDDVHNIRKLRKRGWPIRRIARKYGVWYRAIQQIGTGETWAWLK